MSKMTCDACGVNVTSWSARFGDKDTTFCKKCYGTVEASNVIANKTLTSESHVNATETEVDIENLATPRQNVIVTDIQMPFSSMIVFMVKWAIASIPAMIILFIAFGLVSVFLGGIFM